MTVTIALFSAAESDTNLENFAFPTAAAVCRYGITLLKFAVGCSTVVLIVIVELSVLREALNVGMAMPVDRLEQKVAQTVIGDVKLSTASEIFGHPVYAVLNNDVDVKLEDALVVKLVNVLDDIKAFNKV